MNKNRGIRKFGTNNSKGHIATNRQQSLQMCDEELSSILHTKLDKAVKVMRRTDVTDKMKI